MEVDGNTDLKGVMRFIGVKLWIQSKACLTMFFS